MLTLRPPRFLQRAPPAPKPQRHPRAPLIVYQLSAVDEPPWWCLPLPEYKW